MNIKFMYTPIICLLTTCSIANASYYLTDGKSEDKKSSNLQVGAYNGGGSDIAEKQDFTNASHAKLRVAKQLSANEFIQVEGVVRYLGQDLYGLPNFAEYLNACITAYKPGMKLNAAKEITITDYDKINIDNFKKFIADNLMLNDTDSRSITLDDKFRTFKQSRDVAFEPFNYKSNSILFSLMYYMTKGNPEQVKIDNTSVNYNGFGFTFLPCVDAGAGLEIKDFSFAGANFPYGSFASVSSDSKDSISRSLFSEYSGLSALYKFALFKVEDKTYRVNVKLSTKGSYESKYQDRKISDFLVQVKPKN